MEYNSQRPYMILPEHGRHTQKMVQHCMTIEDREERNKCARAIIDVMGQLNPHLRDVNDFKHKLWDHLFIISDFKLDVDSPYPIPERAMFEVKPEPLPYPQQNIKYKHYGKNVESLIKKCIETKDPVQKEEFTVAIANLMKKFFLTWNRDSVNDEVVFDHLKKLSKGELELKENTNLRATHEILSRNNTRPNTGGSGGGHGSSGHSNHGGHQQKKKFKKRY